MKINKFLRAGLLSIAPILFGINNANAGFITSYTMGAPTSFSVGSYVGAKLGSNSNIDDVEDEKIVYQSLQEFVYPKNLESMTNEMLKNLFDDGRVIYNNFYQNDKFIFNLKPKESVKIAFKWNDVKDKDFKLIKLVPSIDLTNSDKLIEITKDENNIYIKNNDNSTKKIYLVNSMTYKPSDEKEYNFLVGDVKNQLVEIKKSKDTNKNFNDILVLLALLTIGGAFTNILGGTIIRNRKEIKNKQKLI